MKRLADRHACASAGFFQGLQDLSAGDNSGSRLCTRVTSFEAV
jgi:hypothetical protein